VSYRCQGCRDYHRTVYRKLGLGSVCSPECEATVRARQRGGKSRDVSRGSTRPIEPAPGAGDTPEAASGSAGDPVGMPHTGDSTNPASGDTDDPAIAAAPGDAGDIKAAYTHQRDGIHDSKKTQREGTLATSDETRSTTRSRDGDHGALERDRRCRYCGTRANLDVHHIEYRSQGGSNDPHNLIALCRTHHDLVHTNKGLWQPLLRAYIWLLYVEDRRLFLLDIKRICLA
jgi:hypothetical protein